MSNFVTEILIDLDQAISTHDLEMAKFIALVNKSAAGTARENETHLPTGRWRVFTDTVEHPKTCRTKISNFSSLVGMRRNASLVESERKPKYGTT